MWRGGIGETRIGGEQSKGVKPGRARRAGRPGEWAEPAKLGEVRVLKAGWM